MKKNYSSNKIAHKNFTCYIHSSFHIFHTPVSLLSPIHALSFLVGECRCHYRYSHTHTQRKLGLCQAHRGVCSSFFKLHIYKVMEIGSGDLHSPLQPLAF